jgi:hypothetical protein
LSPPAREREEAAVRRRSQGEAPDLASPSSGQQWIHRKGMEHGRKIVALSGLGNGVLTGKWYVRSKENVSMT